MKKKLLVIVALFLILPARANIKVDYDNGIYHAVMTGDKVKKQIQFVSSSNLTLENLPSLSVSNNAFSVFSIFVGT